MVRLLIATDRDEGSFPFLVTPSRRSLKDDLAQSLDLIDMPELRIEHVTYSRPVIKPFQLERNSGWYCERRKYNRCT